MDSINSNNTRLSGAFQPIDSNSVKEDAATPLKQSTLGKSVYFSPKSMSMIGDKENLTVHSIIERSTAKSSPVQKEQPVKADLDGTLNMSIVSDVEMMDVAVTPAKTAKPVEGDEKKSESEDVATAPCTPKVTQSTEQTEKAEQEEETFLDVDEEISIKRTARPESAEETQSTSSAEEAQSGKMYTEADMEDMKKSLKEQATLEQTLLSDALQTSEDRIAQLEKENKEFGEVLKQYEMTLQNIVTEKEHKDEVEHMKLNVMVEENNRIQTQYKSLEQKFQDLHFRYSDAKSLIEEYSKNEKQLKETVVKQQTDLKAAEARFSALKSQAESKLDSASTQINKYKFEIQTRDTTIKDLEEKREELSTQQAKASIETKKLEAELKRLEAANEAHLETIAVSEKTETQLKEKLVQMEKLHGDYEKRVTDLSTELVEQKAHFQSQGHEMDTLRNRIEELSLFEKRNGDLQAQNNQLMNENQILKAKIYDAEMTKEALRAELQKQGGSTVPAAGGDSAVHMERIKQLEADLEQAKTDLAEKEKENAELVVLCEEALQKVEMSEATTA